MSRYSSEIDAIVLKIVHNNLHIDINSSEIPEIISQNIWGLTPKQAYDRVISEIPIDNYDSYDVGNICGNCTEYGFPCANCAAYVYKYYIGQGKLCPTMSSYWILHYRFSKWKKLVQFKPGFRFKY
tara:strand:+ start:7642 stop:8019 length:378 start_codon:yes stop_codon:yes gene_type:complete